MRRLPPGTTGSCSYDRSVNPYTGQAQRGYDRPFDTTGGATGNVSRQQDYNAEKDQTNYSSSVSAQGPGGSSVDRSVSASYGAGGDPIDRTTTIDNAKTGNTTTFSSGAGQGESRYAGFQGGGWGGGGGPAAGEGGFGGGGFDGGWLPRPALTENGGMRRSASTVLLGLLLATPAPAVTQGQLDDFTSGKNGWVAGAQALGGPGGGSDGFLLLTSSGGIGQNSRMVTYNTIQWSGDYLAAGVDAIGLFVNNLGANDLHVRLALGDNLAPLLGGTWYVTTTSLELPAGSGWVFAVFDIGSADLQSVQGPGSHAQLLSDVATLRILSAENPSALGDPIAATLGVDRVVALPEPGAGALLMSGLATLALGGRARSKRVR